VALRDRFTGIFQAVRPQAAVEQVYALLTYAPPAVLVALDDIRRRYDPAFKDGIKPHITIKRPTLLGQPQNLDAMVRELSQVALQLKPFEVVLDGYNTFTKPDTNVAFLKVVDETAFCSLHTQVIEALVRVYHTSVADRFEGEAYHPHLTIGNNLSDLELAVMQHELHQGHVGLHFTFWITSFTLMTQAAGQIWQTVATFNLAGS